MNKTIREKLIEKENVIGAIASICATLMILSLIEVFISNLEGTSNIYIQPLATIFNCFLWSLYGYARKDMFIIIPNISGVIIGVTTTISAFI